MTTRSRQVARIASWVAVRTAHARATKRRSESKCTVTSYEPPSIDPIFPHEIIYHEPLVPVEARCGYSTPQAMLAPLVAYLMGAAVGAIIGAWVWLLWQIVCAVCEWIWG